jgi:hypothetical protein
VQKSLGFSESIPRGVDARLDVLVQDNFWHMGVNVQLAVIRPESETVQVVRRLFLNSYLVCAVGKSLCCEVLRATPDKPSSVVS